MSKFSETYAELRQLCREKGVSEDETSMQQYLHNMQTYRMAKDNWERFNREFAGWMKNIERSIRKQIADEEQKFKVMCTDAKSYFTMDYALLDDEKSEVRRFGTYAKTFSEARTLLAFYISRIHGGQRFSVLSYHVTVQPEAAKDGKLMPES